MDAERWHRIRKLFEQARLQPGGGRRRLLDEAAAGDAQLVAEVEALLASHDEAGTFLERPMVQLPEDDTGGGLEIGDRIGAYRLERLLGHGGMGAVFLAARADEAFRRQVALKVLKRGLDSDELVRRFRSERQILANLEHPNIAELLDGGTTDDGRPYLVMEHVDGIPLDRFCAERRLGLRDRLRLFCRVCDAVQFAHQNLVVHRDLKPGNILVTPDGEPKLMDFGVAKLLERGEGEETVVVTAAGRAPMTPSYASPEQMAGGRITTASDVYSLGVLLFELLTGLRPEAPAGGGERPSQAVARQAAASPPSAVADPDRRRLRRSLRGDLDTIVMMALRPEPERRYPSVQQLAGDVERHLAGLPVSARPDTLIYRASKFLRRHPAATVLTALSFTALVSFSASLLLQRERTLRQQRRAETVSDFLAELFASPDPYQARGDHLTVREVLDRGVEEIRDRLAGQPAVEAHLMGTMGRSYKNLGLLRQARPLLEEALEKATAVHGERHAAVATARHRLAELLALEGEHQRAIELYRRALATRLELQGESHPEVVESLSRLGQALLLAGELEDAADQHARAVALARQLDDPPLLATALERRAGLLDRRGDHRAARAAFEESLELLERHYGERHPEVLLALNDLALLIQRSGALEHSERLLRRAAALQREIRQDEHPALATTLGNLALVVGELGRSEEAEALHDETLAMRRRLFDGEHPTIAATLNNLGLLRREQGRLEEAEALYREALEMQRRTVGERHPDTAVQLDNLGRVLADQQRHDDAEPFFRHALAVNQELFGASHHQIATNLANLAEVAWTEGRPEEAERLYRQAIAMTRATLGESNQELAFLLHSFASFESQRGEPESAEASYAEAVQVATLSLGEEHPYLAMMKNNLAYVRAELGRCDEAIQPAREALAAFSASRPDDDAWVRSTRRILERCE